MYSFEILDAGGNKIINEDTSFPKFIDEIAINQSIMSGSRIYELQNYLYLSVVVVPSNDYKLYSHVIEESAFNAWIMPIVTVIGNTVKWVYSNKLFMGIGWQTPVYLPCKILVFGF